MDITPYLDLMVKQEASDLFFTTNSPIKIKIEGVTTSVGKTVLTGDLVRAAAYGIMDDYYSKIFEEKMEADFSITSSNGSSRFRVNAFHQRGEVGMVLRLIPSHIPTIEQLGLPDTLAHLIMKKSGLILMVGATGSGKTTTLAAMIRHRNENMAGHILTIEDPIEFSHPNLESIVNQREVGVDTLSYHNALKSALRESPNVILLGEIRDRETMEAVLSLANTGHLVVSTLHAKGAPQAIERAVKMFPRDYHGQICMELSVNICAVISQQLVAAVDGKRCAAVEIMINTPHIADLIREGLVQDIGETIENSNVGGMQSRDRSLYQLYKEGHITLEECLDNATSRTNMESKINFG